MSEGMFSYVPANISFSLSKPAFEKLLFLLSSYLSNP